MEPSTSKDNSQGSTGPKQPAGRGGDGEGQRSNLNTFLIVSLIVVTVVFFMMQSTKVGSHVDYSFFYQQLEADNVASVQFESEILSGRWKQIPSPPELDGEALKEEFNTVLPPLQVEENELLPELRKRKVRISSKSTNVGFGTQLLIWLIVPFVFLAFFWMLMRRSADPFSGGMMGNFIRSPARKFESSEEQTTFDDVAAMENAKRELQEVVEFLKNPEKFQRLGAQIPKGVLLMGPPGTGKTLLARATAGEAGVPFYSINGSEFIQMFVGVGASRVRDLFKNAKDNAPCILFVDEIDAVGRVRGAGVGGGHDEREQTLNQILSEMDGFQQNEAVIVLAATNRPDVLDPALLRPGRFDRHITVERPTRDGRIGILKVHCRKVPLADDVDLGTIAGGAIGFSGADVRNLVNEAALNATREGKERVDMQDFDFARDRVLMGPQREDFLNEHERRMTAYHEAGHALLAWYLPEVDAVHKVTIIPRGRALGVTQLLPDEDRYNIGERRLHSQLVMMLGGRAAEKLVFDEFSAGAEDDLKKATQTARRMVAHWGMSEVIGPVAFRQAEEHPFLGKEFHENREFSEETAHTIDQEVQRFLNDASRRATEFVTQRRSELDRLATALLEKESLDRDEMTELFGPRESVANSAPNSVSSAAEAGEN